MQAFSRRAAPAHQGRSSVVARATDTKIARSKVPLELEEGAMPMNTYTPKKAFTAKVKSVKRIVGPKVRLPCVSDDVFFRCPLRCRPACISAPRRCIMLWIRAASSRTQLCRSSSP